MLRPCCSATISLERGDLRYTLERLKLFGPRNASMIRRFEIPIAKPHTERIGRALFNKVIRKASKLQTLRVYGLAPLEEAGQKWDADLLRPDSSRCQSPAPA